MHNEKPKIGLLGLSLDLYDESSPQLKPGREKFIERIIKKLKKDINIDFSHSCTTKKEVDKEISKFESAGFDGIMVIMLTYAPSLIALQALVKTNLPLIIFNTQEAKGIPEDASPEVKMENHGVHGVQDLCSVLNRSNRDYKIITGHWQDEAVLNDLINLCKSAKISNSVAGINIGLIGHSMQDMGDFNIDETLLLSEVGPHIIHISIDEVANLIEKAPDNEVMEIIKEDKSTFNLSSDITEDEHRAQAAFEWSVLKIIEKYDLSGWSQHFNALAASERIPTLPFLTASKLMSKGYGYAAEGDVCAAACCSILQILAGQATLTEMFSMDFEEGAVLMSHMGELNTGMSKEGEVVKVISKDFPMVDKLSPLTPLFKLEPVTSTLLSLAPGPNGSFQFTISKGEIMDFDCIEKIEAPNFKWKPKKELKDFLNGYSEAGGSHHQAMAYGDLIEPLKIAGEFLGMDVNVI